MKIHKMEEINGSDLLKIAIVLTVKAPIEQLRQFLDYHLSIGFDRIYVYFDDPNDRAIREFQLHPKLTIHRCTNDYWQSAHNSARNDSIIIRQELNVKHAMVCAKQDRIDWLAHIDCDELIYPRVPIKKYLQDYPLDHIQFQILEAIPDKLHYDSIFEPKLFRKRPSKLMKKIARRLCKNCIFFGQYFRAHTDSKAMIRLANEAIRIDLHYAVEYDSGKMLPYTRDSHIQLLHFDSIGVDSFKNKFVWRGEPDDPCDHGNKRTHIADLLKKAVNEGESSIIKTYKEIFFLSNYEKVILRLLGLTKKVRIHHLDSIIERSFHK